jgi:hypothetical protein
LANFAEATSYSVDYDALSSAVGETLDALSEIPDLEFLAPIATILGIGKDLFKAFKGGNP